MSYRVANSDTVTTTTMDAIERYNMADSIIISAELIAIENGSWNIGRQNLGSTNITGRKSSNYMDVLLNQIWIIPTKIDAGLVTKTEFYDLYIWNSYLETSKKIEEVIRYNLLDVYFEANLDGYVMKPYEEINTHIIVDEDGVPSINGHFALNIDGIYYYIYVTGKRILIVPAIHFIADSYKITYQYEVAKAVNSFMKEQRRLIHPNCIRSISGNVFIPDMSRNFAINIFDRVGGRVLGVSIPHEKLTPTATNIQGLTTIYVNETLTNYTELSLTKYLLAFREDNYNFECLQVSSIDIPNKKITLTAPAVGSFPKSVTVIYPLLLSKIEDLSIEGRVGNYTVANISVSEVFTE